MAAKKAIVARLEQIKDRAVEEKTRRTVGNAASSAMPNGWDFAEEAAGLGLELADADAATRRTARRSTTGRKR